MGPFVSWKGWRGVEFLIIKLWEDKVFAINFDMKTFLQEQTMGKRGEKQAATSKLSMQLDENVTTDALNC